MPSFAKTDKASADYLKTKKHFALINPLAENIAEKVIKKSLKKKIGEGNYKVKFEVYTLYSLKRGVFKTLEISGKDLVIEDIPIPYLYLKNLTDYNRIDLENEPIKLKSNVEFLYNLNLSEESINSALKQKSYQKKVDKINSIAYPLFALQDVKIKIKNNKIFIIMDYSIPLTSNKKRTFVVSTNFKVENGKIKTNKIDLDKSYGKKLSIEKITNLINLLDPLNFTLAELNEQEYKGNVENIIIEDNIIKISGKIYVKGE